VLVLLLSAVPRKAGEVAGARDPVMPGMKAGKEQRPMAATAMLIRDMINGCLDQISSREAKRDLGKNTFKLKPMRPYAY
jgi:hypothetical protein